jgi:hypothetical protein
VRIAPVTFQKYQYPRQLVAESEADWRLRNNCPPSTAVSKIGGKIAANAAIGERVAGKLQGSARCPAEIKKDL